jgi:hypothetical protein
VVYFSRSASPGGTFVLTGVYFLAAFCFLAFFLPVVTGTMGFGTFVASGLLSLGAVGGILALLRRWEVLVSRRALLKGPSVSAALFVLLNGFYLLNWIPPVPLAMRTAGI